MKTEAELQRLRIYVNESDRWDGKPLYEAIVRAARDERLAGATALRGIEGFPLETRSRVMVLDQAQETQSSVTRVQVGPVAASLFEVPKGYTVVREADAGEATP